MQDRLARACLLLLAISLTINTLYTASAQPGKTVAFNSATGGRGTNAAYTASYAGTWMQATAAGLVATADTNLLTGRNPAVDIVDENHYILERDQLQGQYILLCLQSDDGITTVTDECIVELWGRTWNPATNDWDRWQLLRNRNAGTTATLAIDVTDDAKDGTYRYTTPNYSTAVFDMAGCRQFIVGIRQALATDGVETNAAVWAMGI